MLNKYLLEKSVKQFPVLYEARQLTTTFITIQSYSFKTDFNIIFLFMLQSFEESLSFRFSHQNFAHISPPMPVNIPPPQSRR